MKGDFVDLLIVGQGLAGSALAMRSLERGWRILVIDAPEANRSSAVAAGLFNPITGRQMSKTWMADTLFPVLHRFYPAVEQRTGRRFFYPLRMYRPFLNVEEQNDWMARSAEPGYRAYIEKVFVSPAYGEAVRDPYGGLALRSTGYLDTRAYLEAVATYLADRAALLREWFDPADLRLEAGQVRFRNWRAGKVVFCQGVQNAMNPWFSHVPVKPLKGEFLSVQCDGPADVILNRGVYMVPTAPGRWRVGATYNRNDVSEVPTEQALNDLAGKLRDLMAVPFRVESQQWGLRPASPDRRPMLGTHPDHRSLIIFNGLGTKGVSMAPYFSDVLIRWLENEGSITQEADISRFK